MRCHWDLNLEFQMLVALRLITTSEGSRSELLQLFLHGFNLASRLGVHFGQNVTKTID